MAQRGSGRRQAPAYSADAMALIDLAKSKGLSLYVDHMMVFNAWTKIAKETVQSGDANIVKTGNTVA